MRFICCNIHQLIGLCYNYSIQLESFNFQVIVVVIIIIIIIIIIITVLLYHHCYQRS